MREPRGDLGPLTIDEYLVWENSTPRKHEFVAGRVYSMAGTSQRHNAIVRNVAWHMMQHTRGTACQPFWDLKVRAAQDRVYYPDIGIVCTSHDGDTVIYDDPCLLVEVGSPSTRRIDRGEKLDAYLKIPSVRGYLLIESDRRHATLYSRPLGDEWHRDEIVAGGSMRLPCVGSVLSLDEVYANADPPLRVREDP